MIPKLGETSIIRELIYRADYWSHFQAMLTCHFQKWTPARVFPSNSPRESEKTLTHLEVSLWFNPARGGGKQGFGTSCKMCFGQLVPCYISFFLSLSFPSFLPFVQQVKSNHRHPFTEDRWRGPMVLCLWCGC